MKTTNEYLTKIRQFKQQCAEKYGIISIGIFGSVARGEQHEGSDLDVFVELKEPDPFVMFDIKEELEHICNCKIDKFLQLSESISIIEDRCKNIQNVDDFLLSPWGMTVLDACIMRIQVIGETIKAIDDKTQRSFFKDYPQVPWAKVIGLRNIISHE